MMRVVQGDILKASVEALVNPVNCVGVMEKGLAFQFKKAFPENFESYKKYCACGNLIPGELFLYIQGMTRFPYLIVNFPTKQHWREKSKLEHIDAGLESLVDTMTALGIESIAIPPLGCGLGGLDWTAVRQRIEKAMSNLADVDVFLYEPAKAD